MQSIGSRMIQTVLLALTLFGAAGCTSNRAAPGADQNIQATIDAAVQATIAARQPSSATQVAREFMAALMDGNVDKARGLMSAAAAAQHGSQLPGVSNALRPCKSSTAEFTTASGPGGSLVTATFTPACGNLRTYLTAIFGDLRSPFSEVNRALGSCTITVQQVNEQWRVVESSCVQGR